MKGTRRAAASAERPHEDGGSCRVLTLGHSTRPIEAFVELLRAHRVTQLIDVRTVPRSRHNPQFNIDVLPDSLAAVRIGYEHAPGLGGFRRTTRDSLRMPAGATCPFAAMPTTCRRRTSRPASRA